MNIVEINQIAEAVYRRFNLAPAGLPAPSDTPNEMIDKMIAAVDRQLAGVPHFNNATYILQIRHDKLEEVKRFLRSFRWPNP